MSNCKFNHKGTCYNCGSPQFKKECNVPCDCRMPMTNLEKIKSMNSEEMAEFINTISHCGEISCKDCCLPPQSCGNAKNIEKWLMSANQIRRMIDMARYFKIEEIDFETFNKATDEELKCDQITVIADDDNVYVAVDDTNKIAFPVLLGVFDKEN